MLKLIIEQFHGYWFNLQITFLLQCSNKCTDVGMLRPILRFAKTRRKKHADVSRLVRYDRINPFMIKNANVTSTYDKELIRSDPVLG